MKVYDLKPGMRIGGGDEPMMVKFADVLAVHNPHPRYPNLALVLWQVTMNDGSMFFSHDALSTHQDVGSLFGDNTSKECWNRLLTILPGASS